MPKLIEFIERNRLENIRREWVEEKGKFYFSVVDVIGILTESTDARNYWKVLKNRLKNTQNKLVTFCNQLKMRASDEKFYLTDTLDSENILELIKIISPEKFSSFKLYFDKLQHLQKMSYPQTEDGKGKDEGLEGEIMIDGYENKEDIVIESFVGGASQENISVVVTCGNLTIKGERLKQNTKNNSEKDSRDYLYQELYWGKFSRSITLPAEVEINSAAATLSHGLLVIKLKKIDKLRKKIIEIKTL
jgi:HSP20 family molecular chaperone IbpA